MTGPAEHGSKPKAWFSRFFSPRIEDSVRLRVLVLVSLWLGGLGLYWVGGDFRLTLLGGGLGTIGYWLGWRLRHRRSLVRPLLIASLIVAISFYMRSQMLEVLNGNWMPVGQFMVLVQALSSFDARSRGGLYAGLLLSGMVLFFASQQAFEPSFGVLVVGYIVVLLAFLTMAFLEDGIRDALVHWADHRPGRSAMLPYWIGVACAVFILSGFAFWVMPQGELGLVGPAELAVVPYSGESLSEEYRSPALSTAGLISLPETINWEEPAQSDSSQKRAEPRTLRLDSEMRDLQQTVERKPNMVVRSAAAQVLSSVTSKDGTIETRLATGGDSVFFVRTKISSYWRGRTLEHFDGLTWRTDIPASYLVPSKDQPGVWYDRDNLNRGRRALYQQTFYIRQDSLNAIFTGYSALRIAALDGTLDSVGVSRGTSYRVLSAYPVHDGERLRRDSTWVASPHLVELPAESHRLLSQLAGQIVDGAASDFEKIERIVGYLQQVGRFDPGWPQDLGVTVRLNDFLTQRQLGDAMDYATATVMLARASRLPARLAVGYLPGSRDPLSGAYRVSRLDAHAWAEVYFADDGWIPFDSSPLAQLAFQGRRNPNAGFLFQAGVGDAVFGAVKSAPVQLAGTVLHVLRNPVFSVLGPLVVLTGLVLRWIYARSGKRSSHRSARISYQHLSGDSRRELLDLYGRVEKLLQKVTHMRRQPWQTVSGFTGMATAAEPQLQAQLAWFTQAVWRASYNPRRLPIEIVNEARDRLHRIGRALKTVRGAPALRG